jgi:hypothetical protein
MPSSELFKWRLESAQKYDDSEFSLGDVLDVKASVALAAVAVFAGVSGQLITMPGLSPVWSKIQLLVELVALLLLAVAAALLVSELWPSKYLSAPTPQEDAKWIEELQKEGRSADEILDEVLHYKLSKAIVRVEHNKKINDRKSKLLGRTFKLLGGTIALVLGNLLCLAARAAWPVLKSLFNCC